MLVRNVHGPPQLDWTPFQELHLIAALGGVRFLGINKHFHFARIAETFYAGVGNATGITHKEIIRKLKTYYNLDFEKRDFRDLFPVEDFNIDSSWINEVSPKESEVFTDESSVGSKSESESLSNNSGGESGAKRGKTTKKDSAGRRSISAVAAIKKAESSVLNADGSFSPKKSMHLFSEKYTKAMTKLDETCQGYFKDKSKEELPKKTPTSKKRAGSALKEPAAKKMRVKD